MAVETKEIEYIDFGILSADEIRRYSVCEVFSSNLSGENTIYDPRMGVIENKQICEVCENDNLECPGHFGHIEFNVKIIHPLHYKYVVGLLKCFCYYCSQPLISVQRMKLEGIYRKTGYSRYKSILELVDKTLMCSECSKTQPNFEFSLVESNIYIYFKDKSKKALIDIEHIWKIFNGIDEEYLEHLGIQSNSHPRNLILQCIPVAPPAVRPYVIQNGKHCDDDLTYKYIEIIKMNNKLKDIKKYGEMKRRGFITSLEFHVKTLMDNKKDKAKHQIGGRPIKCLTKRLIGKEGLIRKNLNGKRTDFSARTVIGGDPTLSIEQVGVPRKIARKMTMPVIVNNINKKHLTELLWDGKINNIERNGKNIHMKYALYTRETQLFKDDVLIRDGKRMKIGMYEKQRGEKFVLRGDKKYKQLIEERELTLGELKKLINFSKLKNKAKIFRDISEVVGENSSSEIVNNNPKLLELLGELNVISADTIMRYSMEKKRYVQLTNIHTKRRKNFFLKNGDTVYRHLQDGDIVLLNRQPTLHKMSMLAQRVKILPEGVNTFKLPLAICGSFNADFDGDEMNIFPALSPQSQAEMLSLSTTKKNMISGQSNTTVIKISQDELLGAYLLTADGRIGRDVFFDVVMVNDAGTNLCGCEWDFDLLERMEHISNVFAENGVEGSVYRADAEYNPNDNIWDGRAIFSLVLPKTFDWVTDKVMIKQGVLISGEMSKKPLNYIINLLYKEYSSDIAVKFVNQTTMMANQYLVNRSFSVGMSACCPLELDKDEIDKGVCKFFIEAVAEFKNENYPKDIREMRVNMVLNNAKSVGQKMAHDTIDPQNPFNVMVRAGSKGSDVNICQITSLLGQTNVSGGRINKNRSGGTRTLPHYSKFLEESAIFNDNISTKDLLKVFESRGFIMSSFVKGLNPKEFFFSAMGGREGICDTATKTANSGYLERRMVKFGEDLIVKYDGTVRDSSGKIIEFAYGDDGLDPSKTVHPKGVGSKRPQIIDVNRVVGQLENELILND